MISSLDGHARYGTIWWSSINMESEGVVKQSREGTKGKTGVRAISKNLHDLSTSERAALVMRLKKKPAELTPEQTIQRREDSGPVPLSFAQQRLWFLEQMGFSNYFVSGTSRLTGLLDVKALERSLNEILQRHEALRTTFTTIDGQPMQIIAPRLRLALPVLDLSQLPSDERAVKTRRLGNDTVARRDCDIAIRSNS
jgi:hypothetical protein